MAMTYPHNREFLLNNIAGLRNGGSLCDLVIKSKEKDILAHKVVVAAWSPGLKVQFEEELQSQERRADLKTAIFYNDLDYKSLLSVVQFMYGAKLNVEENNFLQILTVAKVLDVPAVAEICENVDHKSFDDNCEQLTQSLVNPNNETLSSRGAEDFPNICKLPVITEIFFSGKHGNSATGNASCQGLETSGIVATTEMCAQDDSEDAEISHEADEADESVPFPTKVSTDDDTDLTNITSEDSEELQNISGKTDGHLSKSLSTEESLDSENVKESDSNARNQKNEQMDNQTKLVNSQKRRKRGRPRKSLTTNEVTESSGVINSQRQTRSNSKSADQAQKEVQSSKRSSRTLRKRKESSVSNSQNDTEELDSDHSIPVKKRKLKEMWVKTDVAKKEPRKRIAVKDNEKKHNTDMSHPEGNKDHGDDENYECSRKSSGSDSDDTRTDSSKPNKRKRLRIYEKQAAIYDLSFERYERDFVELYELLRCHRCCAEFKDRAALYVHIDDCDVKTAAPDIPIYCSQCDIDFSSNEDLMKHRTEYHSGRRPGGIKNPEISKSGTQRCHLCDLSYKTYKMLEQHLLKIHNYYDPNKSKHRLLKCKKGGCKFMVIRVEAMYAHYKRHVSTNKFRIQCPLCNVSYLRTKWLEGHMRKEHNTKDGTIPPAVHKVNNTDKTRNKGNELGEFEVEEQRNQMSDSSKNDSAKKNFTFECKHCSYKSKKKIALQKHLLGMHREECSEELISRLLRCPHGDCAQEFVEHSALKNHLTLVHGHRSKLHVCGECGAEFLTASSLSGHMRQHKEKTIFCPHDGCDYKTHTNLHLKTHVKHKHLGEEGRDHLCHLCGYRCHSQGNLKLHLLNRHHMDLRFRRIRKKGQQIANAVQDGETLTHREENASAIQEKSVAERPIDETGLEDRPPESGLPNNIQGMEINSISSSSVTQSQVGNQPQIYLQGHPGLQGHPAPEGHSQTDVTDLDNDLQDCAGVVKGHLPVSQSDFYQHEPIIKTNTSVLRDCLPTHSGANQYDMRTQNYPSYMTSASAWQYQSDYNAHYLAPNTSTSFQPSTIHPEEYAQLMSHEHIDQTRNLDLMPNQTESYLPLEHHYNQAAGWKFK